MFGQIKDKNLFGPAWLTLLMLNVFRPDVSSINLSMVMPVKQDMTQLLMATYGLIDPYLKMEEKLKLIKWGTLIIRFHRQ